MAIADDIETVKKAWHELTVEYHYVPTAEDNAALGRVIEAAREKLTIQKAPLWFIYAHTGCSCCANENFEAGPFASREDASAQADHYHDQKRLASQYARNGLYDIRTEEGEILPDGRIICGGQIYDSWGEERQRY